MFPCPSIVIAVKVAEATLAVQHGADEIDMVMDVGRAKMHDWQAVENDIRAVKRAVGSTLLKVILETAALSDAEVIEACQCAERAGANFVKTSTGYHPSGGASLVAVLAMAATVGGRLGIKASGGIKTAAFACELIEAGATRLGLSGTRAVLDGAAAGHDREAAAPADGY